MTASVWLLIRRDLRRRWRAIVIGALLVGLIGAVVMTALAGARRTSSAYTRLKDVLRSADVSIEVSPEYFDAIEALPQVETAAAASYFFVTPVDYEGEVLTIAGVDDNWNRSVDRPLLTEGRRARIDAADEVLLNTEAADQLDVDAGDTLRLQSLSPEQLEALLADEDPGPPAGPVIDVTVVGIGRTEEELANRMLIMTFTPAFYEAYRDEAAHFDDIFQVRLKEGRDDLAAFEAAVAEVVPESEGAILETQRETTAQIENAIRVLALSLVIFALTVALAGFVAIAQAFARQIAMSSTDQAPLHALGLSRVQRFGVLVVPAVLVAVVGAALAMVVTLLASPLMPIGYARQVEPNPGFDADWLVLALGFVALAVLMSALAALSAWHSATHVYDTAGAPAPSRLSRLLSGVTASLPALLGARMALHRGRGRTAVPVGTALTGAAAGVAGLVAALTFSAGLGWTVTEPEAFGLAWDATITGSGGDGLTDDPDIEAGAALSVLPIRLGGIPIQAYGLDPMDNGFVTIQQGRAPTGTDEVVVGSKTLDRLGRQVGDTVSADGLEGGAPGELTIVGRGVFPEFAHPDFPDSDSGAYNDFALLTAAGNEALVGSAGPERFDLTLVRFAAGVDHDAAAARLAQDGVEIVTLERPNAFTNLRRVDSFPAAVAILLILIAAIAVGHALVTSVRHRARDLAVLKTLGFARRQVRASVAWQATTMAAIGLAIGIPTGFVIGRLAWRFVADNLGIADNAPLPWFVIVAIVPAALLLTNLIAAIPAARAARTRPAVVLRTE